MGGTWYVSKLDSRVESLELSINGEDGLKEQIREVKDKVTEINRVITGLNTKLDAIDKYVLDQLRPRASQLLGSPDVGVFRVVHDEIVTPVTFSTPYETSQTGEGFFISLTFTGITRDIHEGEERDFVVARLQLEKEENGKEVKTLYDQFIQILLPSGVGKRDEYCIRFKGSDGSETSPICVEVVLLERVGPNNLIFASAVKPEETS